MFLMKYNKEDRSDVKVCDNQEGYNLGGGSVVNGERVIDLEYWNTIFKIFFWVADSDVLVCLCTFSFMFWLCI